MEDSDLRKLLSALCHGSIFLSALVISVGVPIAIFFISQDPVVKDNAKEALNFHFNLWIYAVIFSILIVVVIGFALLALLGIASLVLPIIAVFKVLENPDRPYRYPFIFRIL